MPNISTKGFQVRTDALRHSRGTIMFLSMYGPRNSVRAVWAALVQGKNAFCDGNAHELDPKVPYLGVSSPLDKSNLHQVIVHPAFTSRWELDKDWFCHLGTPEQFLQRLGMFVGIPVRPEWAAWIWDQGLQERLIQPHGGHGQETWEVRTNYERWKTLVQEGIRKKEIR